MSDVPRLSRQFGGHASVDEARTWIEEMLAANSELTPKGIRVSHSFHEAGLRGEHKGVRIAEDTSLFPIDTVDIEFE